MRHLPSLVARHLSASRFQWQLLGGLMNSTGHSVCPHVTPDWISLLCSLNTKFCLFPLFQIHTGSASPGEAYWQRVRLGALRATKVNSVSSLNWPWSSQGLACVWTQLNVRAVWVRAFKGEHEPARQREKGAVEGVRKWLQCLNAKDVCEEECAVPVICDVPLSC